MPIPKRVQERRSAYSTIRSRGWGTNSVLKHSPTGDIVVLGRECPHYPGRGAEIMDAFHVLIQPKGKPARRGVWRYETIATECEQLPYTPVPGTA